MRVVGFVILVCLTGACGPESDDPRTRHDLAYDNRDGFIDFRDMARNTTSCVGGGTVCSSSNPGMCDKGTVTCDGDKAMCTPDSELQDCYEGLGGTENVGICKGGTQSCVGALGPCLGQVLPAAKEDCFNDADDDCDAKINNTCAESMGLGGGQIGSLQGATTTGDTQIDARCPADSYVSGVDIGLYNDGAFIFSLVQVRIHCATPTVTRTSGSYTLGATPVMPKPYATFGHPSAVAPPMYTTVDCGATGLRGLINWNSKYDAGGYFGLNVRCGSATAAMQPDNTLKMTLAPVGGDQGFIYPLNGTAATWTCPTDQVLIGFSGRAKIDGIYKIAGVCAPLGTLRPNQYRSGAMTR